MSRVRRLWVNSAKDLGANHFAGAVSVGLAAGAGACALPADSNTMAADCVVGGGFMRKFLQGPVSADRRFVDIIS